jgi:hypothetical protein
MRQRLLSAATAFSRTLFFFGPSLRSTIFINALITGTSLKLGTDFVAVIQAFSGHWRYSMRCMFPAAHGRAPLLVYKAGSLHLHSLGRQEDFTALAGCWWK